MDAHAAALAETAQALAELQERVRRGSLAARTATIPENEHEARRWASWRSRLAFIDAALDELRRELANWMESTLP